jgi:N-acetylglucosamine kinase-like BadF-type ATPase
VSLFLGVDGGGTKTALCLLTPQGRVAGSAVVRSSYYLTGQPADAPGGAALVAEVLAEGVGAVCAAAGAVPADISFAFLGLPGYGEVAADVPALDAVGRAVLGHDRYRCGNDMVCGWAGSLGGVDGINVVAGTGSIAYGEWDGARARCGGWGEVFGDEGSGYWIGVRGLQAFSRMSDGRSPAGPLLDLLRRHLSLSSDLDLVDVVLTRWRAGRTRIAALSPVVVDAARHGDRQAGAILADAGAELALLVEAARRRLVAGREVEGGVPVSYSGGVLEAEEVRAAMVERLAALGGFDVRAPRFSPVLGAALHAARLSGAPLAPSALERLQADADSPSLPPAGVSPCP